MEIISYVIILLVLGSSLYYGCINPKVSNNKICIGSALLYIFFVSSMWFYRPNNKEAFTVDSNKFSYQDMASNSDINEVLTRDVDYTGNSVKLILEMNVDSLQVASDISYNKDAGDIVINLTKMDKILYDNVKQSNELFTTKNCKYLIDENKIECNYILNLNPDSNELKIKITNNTPQNINVIKLKTSSYYDTTVKKIDEVEPPKKEVIEPIPDAVSEEYELSPRPTITKDSDDIMDNLLSLRLIDLQKYLQQLLSLDLNNNKTPDMVQLIKFIVDLIKTKGGKAELSPEVDSIINYNNDEIKKNSKSVLEKPHIPSISQHHLKGVSNIFSPKIVISQDDDDELDNRRNNSKTIVVNKRNNNRNNNVTSKTQVNNTSNNSDAVIQSEDNSKLSNLGYREKDMVKRHIIDYSKMEYTKVDEETDMNQSELNRRISKNLMEKAYNPGFSFAPPSTWKVDTKEPRRCIPNQTCLDQPVPVFDKGLPSNPLEYTGVGTILPKFGYYEDYQPKNYKDTRYNVLDDTPYDKQNLREPENVHTSRTQQNGSTEQNSPNNTSNNTENTNNTRITRNTLDNRIARRKRYNMDVDSEYQGRNIENIMKNNKLTKLLSSHGETEGQLKTKKDYCNMFCTHTKDSKRPCTKNCLNTCGETGVCKNHS